MHTLCPSMEDEDGPRTVKLLAVSSLGRIVVYSELQPSEDRVKVTGWLHNVGCVCMRECVCVHACMHACMCASNRCMFLTLLYVCGGKQSHTHAPVTYFIVRCCVITHLTFE